MNKRSTYFLRQEIYHATRMPSLTGWVAKSVARQLATAVLWVRIQTSLKNHKWATQAKEWPTHSSPPKKYTKKKVLQEEDTNHVLIFFFAFRSLVKVQALFM